MAIETGRGLPLYARIAGELRQRIESGALAVGDKAPGENAIADEFGVSRWTAAKALDRLASDGLLARRPGVGSIVTAKDTQPHLIEVGAPAVIRARLPRPGERDEAGAAEWEPLITVSRPGQPDELYPADSTAIVITAG
jgi:DNA-binding GntR family transcriptional regulator